jgi:CubicO group peptidase (beta-lactamase class C family)
MAVHRTTGVIALACAAALLAGCTGAPTPQQPQAPQTAASPAPGTVSQEAVQRGVAALDGIVQDDLAATTVPGVAVGVVYQGKVVYAKGFGVRTLGQPAAVDADTVFQLASVSKAISSTVIAAAVQGGKVAWTDPVRKYLPDFTLADPWVTDHVTIADVLAHRSGLPDHAGDLLEDLGYDQPTILAKLRQEPLAPFRAHYAYTNYGLTAGGVAAAAAAGKPWPDLARETIFGPLGMAATSFRYADFEQRADRVTLHTKTNGGWQANGNFDAEGQAPAGGASSSVIDLTKWMTMLLAQDGLLSAASRQTIWQPQIVRQPAEALGGRTGFYGLGWNIDYDSSGRLMVQHSGAFSHGAATNVLLLPGEGLGIVTLTNAYPIGLAEAINRRFLDAVEQGRQTQDWLAVYGKAFAGIVESPDPTDYGKPPTTVTPAHPAAAYVGTYHSDYWGDLTVTEAAGGLSFTAGPARLAFPLTHYTGDQFFFSTQGESATGNSGATFAGPADRADTVTIAAWNTEGLGTFRR